MKHFASCHCQKVQIEIDAPSVLEVQECNCSMCTRTGFLHVIVPASRFTLLCGEEDLTCYTFNTGVAKHYFCKHCGCKPFYVPRSNPDGFSVNLRCIDQSTVQAVNLSQFNGQEWEQEGAALAHLSRE
ncbi:GFA family protein [Massilia sp. W12]|uniref:GFA family protein n=1 Tax=Massilia sp. W12 TaxID=3126507 RepID=UPI0030CB6DD2